MFPESIFQNLNNKFTIVDFHAPVFQTKAIFFPVFTIKERFFKTVFTSLYQNETLLNSIFQSTFSK